jgi:hypothetical protein
MGGGGGGVLMPVMVSGADWTLELEWALGFIVDGGFLFATWTIQRPNKRTNDKKKKKNPLYLLNFRESPFFIPKL